MKTLRHFFVLTAAILLAACVSATPVIEGNSPQAQAGNAIAQAEIALTKGYRLVADQATAGVLFKSELQEILAVLDKAAAAIDTAKKFYDTGSFGDALNNALDADKALNYVEAEVAKKLRDRRAPQAGKVSWVTPVAAPLTSVEDKNAVCLYSAATFGQQLIDALTGGVPPEKVREAIKSKDPKLRALGQNLLDAVLSDDRAKVKAALDDMVAYCVTLLTKQEQVRT